MTMEGRMNGRDPIYKSNQDEILRTVKGLLIVVIFIIMLCWALWSVMNVLAAESCSEGSLCPIASYQYRCPSNPWEECDPYLRFALPGEQFCKLIIYIETGGVYIRDQYGKICWKVDGGEYCFVMYGHFVSVYTTGNPADIESIYAQYIKREVVRLPMVIK